MAMPEWRQAGGQVRASKITGFDTAFNPLLNHVQRLVDAKERKEAAEKEMQFRREEEQKRRQFQKELAEYQETNNRYRFDKNYDLKNREFGLNEKATLKRLNQGDRELNLQEKELDLESQYRNALLSIKKQEAEARANENKLPSFSTLPKAPDLMYRFTEEKETVNLPEKKRLDIAKQKVFEKHGIPTDYSDKYWEGLKDTYGIDNLKQLKTKIKEVRDKAKNDTSAKEEYDTLFSIYQNLQSHKSLINNSMKSVPTKETRNKQIVDYVASLNKFNEHKNNYVNNLMTSDLTDNQVKRAIAVYNATYGNTINRLTKGAERQQEVVNKQVEAELKAAEERDKLKNNLKRFREEQKIKAEYRNKKDDDS